MASDRCVTPGRSNLRRGPRIWLSWSAHCGGLEVRRRRSPLSSTNGWSGAPSGYSNVDRQTSALAELESLCAQLSLPARLKVYFNACPHAPSHTASPRAWAGVDQTSRFYASPHEIQSGHERTIELVSRVTKVPSPTALHCRRRLATTCAINYRVRQPQQRMMLCVEWH